MPVQRGHRIRFTFEALLFVCSAARLAAAATFHVSPFGSNTPPYDTYAKAAHNIQDAVDQTEANDTVRIGAGIYHPDTTIFLRDSIAVIGAGRDSTFVAPLTLKSFYNIFDLRPLRPRTRPAVDFLLSGCTVWGYKRRDLSDGPMQVGIILNDLSPGAKNHIKDCSFCYCRHGIVLDNVSGEVNDNYFDSCSFGVSIEGEGPFDIHHNTFVGAEPFQQAVWGSGFALFGPTHIHHNVARMIGPFVLDPTSFRDSVVIENNLLITVAGMGLFTYCDCAGAVVRNNTIVRTASYPPWDNGITQFSVEAGSHMVAENNVIVGKDGYILFTATGRMQFAHNALWGLKGKPGDTGIFVINPGMQFDSVGGNLFAYPMFVDDSGYQLQRGSPLIDAGDPAIRDVDGSRSDIGWTGGPGGHSYIYQDLPPLAPESLRVEGQDSIVVVLWNQRPESDLAGYRLYRGTRSGFWNPSLSPIGELGATATDYWDTLRVDVDTVYYVLTAFDASGLSSPPTAEVSYVVSGLPTNQPPMWESVDDQVADIGDTLALLIRATDPDGDSLQLAVLDLPANATFADSGNGHGLFEIIADASQKGQFLIHFVASDGLLADTLSLSITVLDTTFYQSAGSRILKVYPNPIRSTGSIDLSVSGPNGESHDVEIAVHDILGRRIASILESRILSGEHMIPVDFSRTSLQVDLASGVYLLLLKVDSRAIGRPYKVALIK